MTTQALDIELFNYLTTTFPDSSPNEHLTLIAQNVSTLAPAVKNPSISINERAELLTKLNLLLRYYQAVAYTATVFDNGKVGCDLLVYHKSLHALPRGCCTLLPTSSVRTRTELLP